MRFIVDESTGSAVVKFLRDVGHDVLEVAEAIPQATDLEVIALADKESRVLVTNDKDFGKIIFREMIFHSGEGHHGVLLLRLDEESSQAKVSVIRSLLERYADKLPGNFVVASEKRVRVRRLG